MTYLSKLPLLALLCVASSLASGCPSTVETDAGPDGSETLDTPGVDASDVGSDAELPDVPSLDAPPVDVPPSDDGGFDAPPTPDGGFDAPPTPDAGMPDAGTDAGPVDGDTDGVLASLDCDDTNPAIGRMHVEACSSACGSGTRVCTDGITTPCSAPTDCSCPTPGMIRTISCGRCGTASQTCQASGTWSMPSSCFGEGECFAGSVESDTALCGLSERLCGASCSWGPWTVRTPAGECPPGAAERTFSGCATGTRLRTCGGSCAWSAYSDCEVAASGCALPPGPSRSGADTVCIPAGTFILGRPRPGAFESPTNSAPERRVYLSEYYIDRYPVTRARYEMCVTDGACPAITSEIYATLDPDHVVMGGTWAGADAFCTWDGGRLVSEFQYEKAGRGSEPDRRSESWGGTTGNCTHAPRGPGSPCPDYRMRATPTDYPAAVSPFGVRLLGSANEYTSTRSHTYADMDPESFDPVPVIVYPGYIVRGWKWSSTSSMPQSLLDRRGATTAPPEVTFRCVR